MKYEVLTKLPKDLVLPKIISIDTEYSELNVRKARLLSISVGVSPSLTYILEDFSLAKAFIEQSGLILTWNFVVDHYMLHRHGMGLSPEKVIDGMLLEHLVDERLAHGLGDWALRECNDDYKNEFWGNYSSYQDAPKEVAYEYEMRDGCYTYQAGLQYLNLLKDKMDLVKHVHSLQWALFDTEMKGLKVNENLIRTTKDEMSAKIGLFLPELRRQFSAYCTNWELQKWGEEIAKRKSEKGKRSVPRPVFSFSSDRQLGWLLYESLECPIFEKTKKGKPKTDLETVMKLAEERPELATLAEYKETKSVYSTFVEGMLERVEDGRIYPHFNINGTATGRLSHSNPNMANLPQEGVIRNFFIPDMGHMLVGADYSQLEVIVEANLTEDKSLLKIILEGASKHDITSEGLGISRDDAKTLNFALQYGAGIHKVSKILKISHADAQDVFNRYWELYSGVKYLKDVTNSILEKDGQVTNLFGRTRHFDKPENEFERSRNERMAYNFLIQGVGADMTNMATYLIAEEFKAKNYGRLLFSVHDEILTESKENLIDEAKAAIVKQMGVPNEKLNLKYPVSCKLYGPMPRWSKT